MPNKVQYRITIGTLNTRKLLSGNRAKQVTFEFALKNTNVRLELEMYT